MPQNLNQITRDLRNETCPAQVIDEVRQRIRAQKPVRGRVFYASAAAVAGLAMLGCILVWHGQASAKARQQALLAQRIQTVRQACDAMQLIGCVLAEAGAQSGKVIAEQAVPPLRKSLQEGKNKITHKKEL